MKEVGQQNYKAVKEHIAYYPQVSHYNITCLQINLYLEQPMEVQLFATFLQRRK
jgi:hypothetical protein